MCPKWKDWHEIYAHISNLLLLNMFHNQLEYIDTLCQMNLKKHAYVFNKVQIQNLKLLWFVNIRHNISKPFNTWSLYNSLCTFFCQIFFGWKKNLAYGFRYSLKLWEFLVLWFNNLINDYKTDKDLGRKTAKK